MPYNKISGTPNALEFFYLVSDLTNYASLESQYTEIVGEGFPEDLILTEDESDIFDSLLQDSANIILSHFLPYSAGLSDTFVINGNYTPNGGSAGTYVAIKIQDHEVYESGYLNNVDSAIKRCLTTSILSGWLARRGDENKATLIANYLVANVRELLMSAEMLKKPAFDLDS